MHELLTITERANDRRHRRDTEKYEFCTRRRRRAPVSIIFDATRHNVGRWHWNPTNTNNMICVICSRYVIEQTKAKIAVNPFEVDLKSFSSGIMELTIDILSIWDFYVFVRMYNSICLKRSNTAIGISNITDESIRHVIRNDQVGYVLYISV